MSFVPRLGAHLKCELWGVGRKTKRFMAKTQGHPTDLFLKITVLQANFCWLGDLDIEDITRWREDMNFIFEWQNNILRTSAASE